MPSLINRVLNEWVWPFVSDTRKRRAIRFSTTQECKRICDFLNDEFRNRHLEDPNAPDYIQPLEVGYLCTKYARKDDTEEFVRKIWANSDNAFLSGPKQMFTAKVFIENFCRSAQKYANRINQRLFLTGRDCLFMSLVYRKWGVPHEFEIALNRTTMNDPNIPIWKQNMFFIDTGYSGSIYRQLIADKKLPQDSQLYLMCYDNSDGNLMDRGIAGNSSLWRSVVERVEHISLPIKPPHTFRSFLDEDFRSTMQKQNTEDVFNFIIESRILLSDYVPARKQVRDSYTYCWPKVPKKVKRAKKSHRALLLDLLDKHSWWPEFVKGAYILDYGDLIPTSMGSNKARYCKLVCTLDYQDPPLGVCNCESCEIRRVSNGWAFVVWKYMIRFEDETYILPDLSCLYDAVYNHGMIFHLEDLDMLV